MRVLVVGGTGLIAAATIAKMRAEGHEVAAIVRRIDRASRRLPIDTTIALDIARAKAPRDWTPHLRGVDAVVNCAGIVQDGPNDSLRAVHVEGIAALFAACEAAGVKRVVHLSAIGVDRETPSDFSRTKMAGDLKLMESGLDWVILRPAVVVGRAAYGGSALFRGLAALPFLPAIDAAGPLQVVQLDELVDTIIRFLPADAPSKIALDIAGPERLTLTEIAAADRRWLGFPPQRPLKLPRFFQDLAYRAGDFLGWLGWRPPIRGNVRDEFRRGAVGEPARWMELTGIQPQSLGRALAAEPASVQEKWFAQLYFLKPLLFAVFAFFWIMTGVISLTSGWEIGKELMAKAGMGEFGPPGIVIGALTDIVVGILICLRRHSRLGLHLALAVSAFYVIVGSLLMPGLWNDPVGPMLKIWPVIGLNLVLLAILDDR